MTKFADPKPPYCASCFGDVPGRYVDFEAAYDGPVLEDGEKLPVSIDELIICENCLAEAFELLDPQGMRQTIADLERVVTDLLDDNTAKDKAIQGYQFTTEQLVDHPVAKFPGKPRLEGVSPEIRKLITQRLYERRGTSSANNQKAAA